MSTATRRQLSHVSGESRHLRNGGSPWEETWGRAARGPTVATDLIGLYAGPIQVAQSSGLYSAAATTLTAAPLVCRTTAST